MATDSSHIGNDRVVIYLSLVPTEPGSIASSSERFLTYGRLASYSTSGTPSALEVQTDLGGP